MLQAGCINSANIETEKLSYSQGQWTIPFEIIEEETPASKTAP